MARAGDRGVRHKRTLYLAGATLMAVAIVGIVAAVRNGRHRDAVEANVNCLGAMRECERSLGSDKPIQPNVTDKVISAVKEVETEYEMRRWFTNKDNSSYLERTGGMSVSVSGVEIPEFDNNPERECAELPLWRIIERMVKWRKTSTQGGALVTGWQGCVISCKDRECETVDARARTESAEDGVHEGHRLQSLAYKVLRNQVIAHTTYASGQDYYVGVQNVFTETLFVPVTSLQYVTEVLAYSDYAATARDVATSTWGGFDIVHLLEPDKDFTRVKLTVGRSASQIDMAFYWIETGYSGDFGHVCADSNKVECVPNWSSMYASFSGRGSICLEVGDCGQLGVEIGAYMNGCGGSTPTNAYSRLPGGISTWNMELGRTTRNANYGGVNLEENSIGEIFLTLTEAIWPPPANSWVCP
ncbi:unnamed protein product [Cylindrotheca closterium]|uniref:Uncharacterized protein n=1 Tax=Cylindrotheca closterium TaxID=2856 RepID=A0AAD2FTJ7_9STRA|nr:unnamed protein product [Cylindrotheca closterium]